MNNYELKVTISEMDQLISRHRFKEAAELADTVDWRRVRDVRTLCRVSDVYKINRRYEESKRVLELAYAKKPNSRQIIFSLCELELKVGNHVRALQLYNEYLNVAPRDSDRYILQYKLYKAHNVSVNERIAVLEEMARYDMRDRWFFELAKLYMEAGERSMCASQCDEIVACFGDGKYVRKALELKASFSELTPSQKALYKKMTGEEPGPEPDGSGTPSETASVKEVEKEENEKEGTDLPKEPADTGASDAAQQAPGDDSVSEEAPQKETGGSEAEVKEPDSEAVPETGEGEASAEETAEGDASEADKAEEAAEAGEIPDLNLDAAMSEIPWEYEEYEVNPKELKKRPAAEKSGKAAGERDRREQNGIFARQAAPAADHSVFEDHSFEISPEESFFSQENMQKTIIKGMQSLDNYDTYLRQETDGQYAMVMQEEQKPDKQITGQLNLEDIMSEWEKVKKSFYEFNGIEETEPEDTYAQAPDLGAAAVVSTNTKSWDPREVHKALEIRDDDEGSAKYDTSLFVTEGGGDFPEEFAVEKMPEGGRNKRATGPIYLHSEDSIRQLTKALDQIFLEGGTGNVIITGDEGVGTLSLARELVRRYRQINPNFVGQIAKSEGRYITRENMLRVIPRMPFGALIIERASMMSEEGAASLNEMLRMPERSILIIMIDRKGVMDAFLNDHPDIREMFPARVDIAALSVDTLLGYAREYAGKQQCEIDEYGFSALQSRVMSMQTVDHSVTLEDIRDIVDEAIYYASRKTLSSLVDSFSRRKGGVQNRIILRDKDFLHY